MAEKIEKKNNNERSWNDCRFELTLMVNENIICQRFFKINRLRERALGSLELKDAMDYCVNLIDSDLKSKTRIYSFYTAPQVFRDKEEMLKFFANPYNGDRVRFGETLYLRNDKSVEYWWNGEKPVPYETTINEGEFTDPINDEQIVNFRLYLRDKEKGHLLYDKIWDGKYYPRFVRNGIDLSNKKGQFQDTEISRLSFESALLYRMYLGKTDLVNDMVKEICETCSDREIEYTLTDDYVNEDGTVTKYSYDMDQMWKELNDKLYLKYKNKTSKYFATL